MASKANQEGRGGAGAVSDAGKNVRVVAKRQSVLVNLMHTLADLRGDDRQFLPEIRRQRAGRWDGRGLHFGRRRNGNGGRESRSHRAGERQRCIDRAVLAG